MFGEEDGAVRAFSELRSAVSIELRSLARAHLVQARVGVHGPSVRRRDYASGCRVGVEVCWECERRWAAVRAWEDEPKRSRPKAIKAEGKRREPW
jgi:hypothetical protein